MARADEVRLKHQGKDQKWIDVKVDDKVITVAFGSIHDKASVDPKVPKPEVVVNRAVFDALKKNKVFAHYLESEQILVLAA